MQVLDWHSSRIYTKYHHLLGKDNFGVSHSMIAYENDNPHSSIQGFQIVNIPPDS